MLMPTTDLLSSETLGMSPVIGLYQALHVILMYVRVWDTLLRHLFNHYFTETKTCACVFHCRSWPAPKRFLDSFCVSPLDPLSTFSTSQSYPVTSIYHLISIRWEQRGAPFLPGFSFSIFSLSLLFIFSFNYRKRLFYLFLRLHPSQVYTIYMSCPYVFLSLLLFLIFKYIIWKSIWWNLPFFQLWRDKCSLQ